jgi:hypothetical protein
MNWNELFEYEDGNLIRLYDPGNSYKHVGWVNSQGYLQTEVFGKTFMVHRIIYEMHSGEIPDGMYVDHIDRNPLNNRIENLRAVDKALSKINTKTPVTNTTGYKGVLATPSGRFQARLGYKRKKLYIGLYDTAEEAAQAVKEVAMELYGEFHE